MRKHLSAASFGLILGLTRVIACLPNVTVSRLPDACSSYPQYNKMTGEAGPFIAVADSTGSAIDGLEVSAETFTDNGIDQYGFITLPKERSSVIANITMRCLNASLQAYVPVLPPLNLTTRSISRRDASAYVDLQVSTDVNWQSQFGFHLSPSVAVEPYAHYLNGTRLPGVFLGAKGNTTWFYKYNWAGVEGEYYLVRLMGQGADSAWNEGGILERRQYPSLDDRNWLGYLKIAE